MAVAAHGAPAGDGSPHRRGPTSRVGGRVLPRWCSLSEAIPVGAGPWLGGRVFHPGCGRCRRGAGRGWWPPMRRGPTGWGVGSLAQAVVASC